MVLDAERLITEVEIIRKNLEQRDGIKTADLVCYDTAEIIARVLNQRGFQATAKYGTVYYPKGFISQKHKKITKLSHPEEKPNKQIPPYDLTRVPHGWVEIGDKQHLIDCWPTPHSAVRRTNWKALSNLQSIYRAVVHGERPTITTRTTTEPFWLLGSYADVFKYAGRDYYQYAEDNEQNVTLTFDRDEWEHGPFSTGPEKSPIIKDSRGLNPTQTAELVTYLVSCIERDAASRDLESPTLPLPPESAPPAAPKSGHGDL